MMQQIAVPVRTEEIEAQAIHGAHSGFHASTSKGLGIVQLAIGISTILIQILAIGGTTGLYFVGHGIWCGAFFIVAGSFGIAAERTRRNGFIITFMVLSILAASLFASTLLACAALGLHICNNFIHYYQREDGTCRATEGLLLALAVLEGIIAVISSAICCRSLCSPSATTGGHLFYSQASGGQMARITARQPQFLSPGIAAAARTEAQSGPYPFQAVGLQSQLQPTAGNTDQPPPAYSKVVYSAYV